MAKFWVRFSVDNSTVDDVIEAIDLLDATGQVHSKLSRSTFTTTSGDGTAGSYVDPSEVQHITIMSLEKAQEVLKPTIRTAVNQRMKP